MVGLMFAVRDIEHKALSCRRRRQCVEGGSVRSPPGRSKGLERLRYVSGLGLEVSGFTTVHRLR